MGHERGRAIVRGPALLLAIVTLVGGPWLGLPVVAHAAPSDFIFDAITRGGRPLRDPQVAAPAPQRRLSYATGCSCREVVVDVSNVVRDADIRTGDASVVNKTITYIAPTYGDDDVEVEQEAEAITGDAIAGQVLGVDGGPGCSRVRVSAKNIVEDSEIRTGDALAKNKSVILLDPTIRREDLEIEVDQEAEARSGDAIAGQVIGVNGGGPCGGVILDALNRVRNVEIRTGEATTKNVSDILTCFDPGCIDDLHLLLQNMDTVDVCDANGCAPVPVKKFIELIKNPPEVAADEGADEDDDANEDARDALEDRDENLDNEKVREAQPWRFPKKKPTPSPTPAPTPPPPTPSPSPASEGTG